MENIIADISLANAGEERIRWYAAQMKTVGAFHERYAKERPFEGMSILVCMHCEPKAAVRTKALLAAGVNRLVFIGNLGSTKDDVAAYLAQDDRITVMARKDDTLDDLKRYVDIALKEGPYDLFMDNGAAIMSSYAEDPYFLFKGGIEETRSGKLILEERKIDPDFPLLVIDDSPVKRLIENESGVGQSVVDGFMTQTSMLIGGKKILIIGYGWCGRGVSQRFHALGAHTYVYDVDNVRMLKAKIEGHQVGKLEDLLKAAEVVITVTGRFNVLTAKHLEYLQDGAIIANAGHYNMEIDLEDMARSCQVTPVKQGIDAYKYGDKTFYVLQKGNPLNLSAASGNPIEIMELGYALQLLSLEQIVKDPQLKNGVQALPDSIDQRAAGILLGLDS